MTAASGEEAVDLYRQAGPFRAVVLDAVMPGMSGEDTLLALRRVAPDIVCYFLTGATDGPALQRLQALAPAGVFTKPAGLDDLVRALGPPAAG